MRRSAPTPRIRLVCLVLCCLLVTPLALLTPGGSAAGKRVKTVGAEAVPPAPPAQLMAPAANLPNLDESRRRSHAEPQAAPPIPSSVRRCPPRNPRCNEPGGGTPGPQPTPTGLPAPGPPHTPPPHTPPPLPLPSATPGLAARAGGADDLLASFATRSLLAVVASALNGGRTLVPVPALDYFLDGGGHSVSDATHSGARPTSRYRAGLLQPEPAAFFQTGRVNVALSSNGATATASSSYNGSFPAAAAINGDRRGSNWGAGGGWNDATANNYPDWLEVAFAGAKTIDEVSVFTIQDNFAAPAEPTESQTFALYGVTAFEVQHWDGAQWLTVPGGQVTGNNKVWRRFSFAPVTTTKVRVLTHSALDGYSRVAEVEAYEVHRVNHALAANGGLASASSSASTSFPAAAANNGDRKGLNWGAGGGWNDGTNNAYPDWLQLDFTGRRAVDEINVFTLQDNFASPAEPTEGQTFTLYGVTSFTAQYWDGAQWLTVPGGSVSGNNKVWRRISFAPVTTDRVRVLVGAALDGYSRVAEVEAWGPAASPTGTGTGLTGRYYDNLDFVELKKTRADAAINFDWGAGAPDTSVGAEEFSVRWSGMVEPRYTETYTFHTTSDDGARLWVDGQLIVDRWVDQPPTEWAGTVALEAGRQYPITMEFYDRFHGAAAKLQWSSASQPKQVVPQSQLYGCWKGAEQFVKDFFQSALSRQPAAAELEQWSTRLAQAQSEALLASEARALGLALFDLSASSAYTARSRSDRDFVYDLYRGYLQRAPDLAGLNHWTAQVSVIGRANVRGAFAESIEFGQKVTRLCGTSVSNNNNGAAGYDFSAARLDPANRTGATDPYSRNFHWSIPVVSLPGRAGHDLGLSLSYNSLVWTRDGDGVTFDADNGFPGPGFRLGFPVIQPRFFNARTQKHAYLLLTPSGARVELRQVGTSSVYESADSSYLRLDAGGGTLVLLTADGSRLDFSPVRDEFKCTRVTDRNGNYLTAGYGANGQLAAVVDTLGRTLSFNYDANGNLLSVTQPWRRETETGDAEETHVWASFGYGPALTLAPNAGLFGGLAVIGTQGGTAIPVLRQVSLSDGTVYKFEYNVWGQVRRVARWTKQDANPTQLKERAYTAYDLPGAEGVSGGPPQTDCPRFNESRSWAEYWNGDADGVPAPNEEAVTVYNTPWANDLSSCEVTEPDGTKYFAAYATSADGWKKGLNTATEVKSGGQVVKMTSVVWEHDGAADASYATNPRVTETFVSDSPNDSPPGGRLTRITYTTPADFRPPDDAPPVEYRLPKRVEECNRDCSAVLRTTVTDYKIPNLGEYYQSLARRIVGLPRFRYLYEGAESPSNLRAKVGFVYDEQNDPADAFLSPLPQPATQHNPAFDDAFRWRGNTNRVRRYDVNGGPDDYVERRVAHNVTGSVVRLKDAAGHETAVGYADSFYGGVNRSDPALQTFAYPTALTVVETVPAAVSVVKYAQYNYDFGETRQVTDPKGAVVRILYDAAGRPLRTARYDGAEEKGYVRQVYPPSLSYVNTFTLTDPGKEAYTSSVLDGAGRVRAASRYLPPPGDGGTGTYSGSYSGQLFIFDSMGRLSREYNPTEINADWNAVGDDAAAGWVYTSQTYDWKGRPRVRTNAADNTTREAVYEGCGCAGGEVVTTRDEVGRRQKVTFDLLGRVWKTQILSLQPKSQELTHGSDADVYSTTTNTYNALDQLTEVKVQAGVSGAAQVTTLQYDGHGRLWKQRGPSQTADTVLAYNADDTLAVVTDARGATATYSYNDRHLVTGVVYAGGGVPVAPAVGYGYDAAGNRIWMTDNLGGVTYQFDTLSRMTSETRQFADTGPPFLHASHTLTYDYNMADALKSVVDNTHGTTVAYDYDRAGQLKSVGSSPGGQEYISGVRYRAWGAAKRISYGNTRQLDLVYNSRLQVKRAVLGPAAEDTSAYHQLTTAVGGALLDKVYNYNDDGRVSYARDFTSPNGRLDRSFGYDSFTARLTSAFTGYEARPGGQQSEGYGPYRQTFGYDVWGNLTSRSWRSWQQGSFGPLPQTNHYSAVYTDDRNTNNNNTGQGWHYDAAGNLTSSTSGGDTFQYVYNSAGQLITATSPGRVYQQAFDGDGLVAKTAEGNQPTYYVRSTALGGQVVEELGGSGQKLRGYVYAGGQRVAKHEGGQVQWSHGDAAGTTSVMTNSSGVITSKVELDPLGVKVDDQWSQQSSGGTTYNYSPNGFYGNPRLPDMGCRVDGLPTACDWAARQVNSGATAVCPDNNCGPRPGTNAATGRTELYRFDPNAAAYGIGTFGVGVGFLPPGVSFVGNGFTLAEGRHALFRGRTAAGAFLPAFDRGGGTSFYNLSQLSDMTGGDWLSLGHGLAQQRYDRSTLSDQNERIRQDDLINQAFVDAEAALLRDGKCRSFLGLEKSQVNGFINSLLRNAGTGRLADDRVASTVGSGSSAKIVFGQSFFSNTQYRYYDYGPDNARQWRALTVLHEMAHARRRIPEDGRNSQQNSANDKKVLNECMRGIGSLPTADAPHIYPPR